MATPQPSIGDDLKLLCAAIAPDRDTAIPIAATSRLQALAKRHGLVPLFSAALARQASLPADLRDQAQLLAARNLQQTQELLAILHRFAAEGIRCLAFKGPALALLLHRNVGMREFLDLDLLIAPADIARSTALLQELGYVCDLGLTAAQSRILLKTGTDLTFLKRATDTSVELHWQIAHAYVGVRFDFQRLCSRHIEVQFGSHHIATFSPSDQLLLLSLHGIRHFWESLCWVADIAYLISRCELDWAYISQQARSLRLEGAVQVALALAQEFFSIAPPPAFRSDEKAVQRAIELSLRRIASATNPPELSGDEHLALASLTGGKFARMRYLSRLAGAVGPTEWQAVRLPAHLHSLYKVVRLYRLTRRLTAHSL